MAAHTGSVEPDWNIFPYVDDYELRWYPIFGFSFPFPQVPFDTVWQALQFYNENSGIIAGGYAYQNLAPGTSGATIPDFGAGNGLVAVSDGSITWEPMGPYLGTWQPNTPFTPPPGWADFLPSFKFVGAIAQATFNNLLRWGVVIPRGPAPTWHVTFMAEQQRVGAGFTFGPISGYDYVTGGLPDIYLAPGYQIQVGTFDEVANPWPGDYTSNVALTFVALGDEDE